MLPSRHDSFPRRVIFRAAFLFVASAFLLPSASTVFAQMPGFTQIWVFGDSLSDDGNIKHKTESKFVISYPSDFFNYADGRFTNSASTDPGSGVFVGVWHEQLARTFLGLPAVSNSLDGGADYAFGGATTNDGTSERTVISNASTFGRCSFV